jgi:NitT/TauT family transport system permease protein
MKWSQLLFVKLQFAMPSFFVGMKTSAVFAVIGVVVAEFLASGDGVGFAIVDRMGRADTPGAFASIIAISLIGLVVYYSIAVVETFIVRALRLQKDRAIM